MTTSRESNQWGGIGNGVAVDFDVDERVQDSDFLSVYLVNRSTLEATLQTEGTHYNVLGENDDDGVTVRFVTAPTATYEVVILLEPPLEQSADLRSLGGRFNAVIHEDALDRLNQQIRRLWRHVQRSIRAPITEALGNNILPALAARKGKFLKFNATTGDLEASDGTGAGASDFLGLPTAGTTVAAGAQAIIQTAAQVGTNATTSVDVAELLASQLDQADHISSLVPLTTEQLARYNTNEAATSIVTFELPAGSDNAYGYFGRMAGAPYQIRLQPDGTEAFLGGVAGEYVALMSEGSVGIQWLDGKWRLIPLDARIAYQTPKSRSGDLWLDDDPTMDLTGVVENSVQLSARFAQAAASKLVIRGLDAAINVGNSVELSAPFHGPSFPYISSAARLRLVPTINGAATPVLYRAGISDGYDGADLRDVWIGNPGSSGPTDTTTCIGVKLGAPGVSPEETFRVGRSFVENVCIYGLSTGMYWQGWTNTGKNIHIGNCGLGFYGDYLNDTQLQLKISNCEQPFKINNSTGLELNVLFEGTAATGVAATIDGCHAIKMVVGYAEHGSTSRTDYLLKIGTSTEVTGLDMFITASAVLDLTAGKVCILLDRVNGGTVYIEGSAGSMHGLLLTTANTKNVKIIYTKELGKWPLEGTGSNLQGPLFNHFPNCDFSAWKAAAAFPRGWYDAVITGVTVSQRTKAAGHDVRRGQNAMRITATGTGVAQRSVEFWISGTGSPTCLALRGKTIITGAWIWIPDTAEFAEADLGNQHCNVLINTYSYDGSTVNQGSALNGSFTHHTKRGAWNFIWTETVVHAACTRLVIEVYLSTSGAPVGVTTAADAYIDIDSIHIAESGVIFEDFMAGALPDAPTIDAKVEGGKVRMFTDVGAGSTDTTQYFCKGDILEKLTPVSGAAWRSVCVTDGAGGTAGNWKTEGALS